MCQFSFIVPIYNVKSEYLLKCLDSILSNTMNSFEVILVDDKSTNGIREICDKYCAKDNRVRAFYLPENAGVSYARNYGVSQCIGEWVIYVDADDWVEEDICEKISAITTDETDIVLYSAFRESINYSFQFGTAKDKVSYTTHTITEDEINYTSDLSDNLLKQSLKTTDKRYETIKYCWGKAFRRSFIEETSLMFPQLDYCEDIVYMADAFNKARYVIQIPERLYHYRINATSAVNTYRNKAISEQIAFLELLNEKVGNEADTIYYAGLLSMQICITRYFYNKENEGSIFRKHNETRKLFMQWPYSDVFQHVKIKDMKRSEKQKALLLKHGLYYLYYLGTQLRKIKTVRYK